MSLNGRQRLFCAPCPLSVRPLPSVRTYDGSTTASSIAPAAPPPIAQASQAEAIPDQSATPLETALLLATRHRIPVFPCSATKAPLIPNGFKGASTDPDQIRRWWRDWPDALVAIPTGSISGLLFLDVDPDGAEWYRSHAHMLGAKCIHETPRGKHLVFRMPKTVIRCSAGRLAKGIDIRAEGGYVIFWPAHGLPVIGDLGEITPLPSSLLDLLQHPAAVSRVDQSHGDESGQIPAGTRNSALTSYAGSMRRKGIAPEEIAPTLLALNERRCRPPLDHQEVLRIAKGIGRYEPVEDLTEHGEPAVLTEVVDVYNRAYCEPDIGQFYIALGTVAANLLPADPVWTLIVNPPSAGKTEAIRPLYSVSYCHEVGTLTEAALLSGTARKDKAKDATGGLLRILGEFGVLLLKDFTSIISMDRNARAAVMAALREVFDGHWTRAIGTDGGKTLSWHGKVGLVGAVTNAYDSHHAVIGAMGDRFVLYRAPVCRERSRARALHKIKNVGREKTLRAEVAECTRRLFLGLRVPNEIPSPPEEDLRRLADLATLATISRSTVERDGRTREVELVHGEEAPMRLAGQLATLWHGLKMIGVPVDEQWPLICKVALDSCPPLRMAVLQFLIYASGPETLRTVSQAVRHPAATTRRALEDLTAHGLLRWHGKGACADEIRADGWSPELHTLELWRSAMSQAKS